MARSGSGTTARVVVGLSAPAADVHAARWAADYAERCGCGLVVAHAPDQAASARELAVRLRADSPGVDVSTLVVREPIAHGLAAEVRTPDLIVLAAGAEPTALADALTARARCPVVAIPPGATCDHRLPVVVGTDGGRMAEAAVLAGFALATALGTDMRVVCCLGAPVAGPRFAPMARATLAVTDSCAERYPDVPVDVRVARSHAVTGLIRHARLASALVIGSDPTGDDSTSRRVLHRSAGPVALVGPRVPAHRGLAVERG